MSARFGNVVSATRGRRGKMRVSLAILFGVFTLCIFVCAFYLRSGTHVTSSTLLINTSSVGERESLPQPLNAYSVAELLHSEVVLNQAANHLQRLPLLADVKHPVPWLRDHIKVRVHDGGDLISAYMYCTNSTGPDAIAIVDLVVQMCMSELTQRENGTYFGHLETLESALRKLSEEIEALESLVASQPKLDAILDLRLQALKQSYIDTAVRKQRLEIARSTASANVAILNHAQNEIRGLSMAGGTLAKRDWFSH